MKHLMIGAAMAVIAGAACADEAEGVWQTQRNDEGNIAHVQIAPCGPKLCGTLIRSFGPDNTPIESANIGKNIVWDMEADGAGNYANGQIWDPGADKTYRSKMALAGNELKVSGCVAGGLLCRSQTWIRVK